MKLSPNFVLNVTQEDNGIKTLTIIKVGICHMKTYAELIIHHYPSQWKYLQL